MKLQYCTLTGVDEHCDLRVIESLSVSYPLAEWGFLYTPKQQGLPGRYPSMAFLSSALAALPKFVNTALHVCGKGVNELLNEEHNATVLLELMKLRGGRIQLNVNHARKPVDITRLKALMTSCPTVTFITQHNEANTDLWLELRDQENHAILFDTSGGRGISPSSWPKPLPLKCGYAGGHSVENIVDHLNAIEHEVLRETIWIDAEGSLRDVDDNGHDWLNLERCEAMLKAASAFDQVRHGSPIQEVPMSPSKAGLIYEVLMASAGAHENRKEAFIANMTGPTPTREWRFGGNLGEGGIFCRLSMFVDCYPDDLNADRERIIQETNHQLRHLK
ncbi:MAG: hypothetical protein RSD49_21000 [Hafnia sp.]